MYIFKNLKEGTNKAPNEVCENTNEQLNETMKISKSIKNFRAQSHQQTTWHGREKLGS